jgi:Homing endonuclease associated repeat
MEKNMTKEEIIAAMKESATTLGYAPSLKELENATGVKQWNIGRIFGTYGQALEASGLERQGSGYTIDLHSLFVRWAEVARKLGRIPTACEYEAHGKHNARPLIRRCGGWLNVPRRLLEYIRMAHLEGEWKDVVEVIVKHLQPATGKGRGGNVFSNLPSNLPSNLLSRPKIMLDQPMYGAPLLSSPLSCAPINELGVVFLFGAVARQMGFVVTRLQQEFPDCEALRQVELDRWQRVLIEFEFESRNFLLHDHRAEDCDLIVCWNHNWAECPLEVLELKNVVWS